MLALRPAVDEDKPFIEAAFFAEHRWMIEKLVTWRGDEFERMQFYERFVLDITSIIVVDGIDIGWISVRRDSQSICLEEITVLRAWQNQGLGTLLIRQLIEEARTKKFPLRLSTAKINPARRLYERLGFRVTGELQFKVEMEIPAPA